MSETTFPMASASLPVRFVIYLPAMPEDSLAPAGDIEAAVVRILCERFGGVTAYPAKGTFTLASGIAQTEAVTVLETYCEREAWRQSRPGVAAMARKLAWLLGQEALGCSVDGKMVLIEADDERPSAPGREAGIPEIYPLLLEAFE